MLAVAACGLKGPLYMPGEPPARAARSAPEAAGGTRPTQDPARRAPAPQSQKRDRDTHPPVGRDVEPGDIPGGNEAPLTPPGPDRAPTPPRPQGEHE